MNRNVGISSENKGLECLLEKKNLLYHLRGTIKKTQKKTLSTYRQN